MNFIKTCFIALMAIFLVKAYSQEKETYISDRLEKKWETPSDFKVPESVCYEPIN